MRSKKQNKPTSTDVKNYLAIAAAILSPLVTSIGVYYSTVSSLNARISDLQLSTERRFVPKEDYGDLAKEIKQISKDVAEIKGILKKR